MYLDFDTGSDTSWEKVVTDLHSINQDQRSFAVVLLTFSKYISYEVQSCYHFHFPPPVHYK